MAVLYFLIWSEFRNKSVGFWSQFSNVASWNLVEFSFENIQSKHTKNKKKLKETNSHCLFHTLLSCGFVAYYNIDLAARCRLSCSMFVVRCLCGCVLRTFYVYKYFVKWMGHTHSGPHGGFDEEWSSKEDTTPNMRKSKYFFFFLYIFKYTELATLPPHKSSNETYKNIHSHYYSCALHMKQK